MNASLETSNQKDGLRTQWRINCGISIDLFSRTHVTTFGNSAVDFQPRVRPTGTQDIGYLNMK